MSKCYGSRSFSFQFDFFLIKYTYENSEIWVYTFSPCQKKQDDKLIWIKAKSDGYMVNYLRAVIARMCLLRRSDCAHAQAHSLVANMPSTKILKLVQLYFYYKYTPINI